MMLPNNWVEEDRENLVSEIVDGMISEMTLEQLRQSVWDRLYEDLVWQDWSDLWMHAEQYAPDLVEQFQEKVPG
jgi:hypothetical protein